MQTNKQIGLLGEDIAADFLISQGYHILKRNFNCKLGEIDIIAVDNIDKNELVFVEVKTRRQNIYGSPSDAVDFRKTKHLYKVAEYFLMINKLENTFVRFDVIEIKENFSQKIRINHIKNVILDRPEKNVTFISNAYV